MSNDATLPAGLSRRGFLTAGGALVGASLLLGPNRGTVPTALSRLASKLGTTLSLGYVEGSKGMTSAEIDALLATGGARVVPATSLRSGGATRDGGAVHVRVSGGGASPTVSAASLDALMQPVGAANSELVPFYVWTMTGSTATPSARFVVPFEQQPTIGLSMKASPAGAPVTEALAVMTGGGERGLAKLNEGAYLVGFGKDAWAHPKVLAPVETGVVADLDALLLSVHAL